MGISIESIKAKIFRAREKMRPYLAQTKKILED
jgi:DNA-directed RNA polymerase specialized sigma24 family protein